MQQNREECISDHCAVKAVRVGSPVALAISLHALAVICKAILRLADPGIHRGKQKNEWIGRTFEGKLKLLLWR